MIDANAGPRAVIGCNLQGFFRVQFSGTVRFLRVRVCSGFSCVYFSALGVWADFWASLATDLGKRYLTSQRKINFRNFSTSSLTKHGLKLLNNLFPLDCRRVRFTESSFDQLRRYARRSVDFMAG